MRICMDLHLNNWSSTVNSTVCFKVTQEIQALLRRRFKGLPIEKGNVTAQYEKDFETLSVVSVTVLHYVLAHLLKYIPVCGPPNILNTKPRHVQYLKEKGRSTSIPSVFWC